MSIVQSFLATSPHAYTTPLAHSLGNFEHKALRYAEFFGLKVCQAYSDITYLLGAVSAQEQFRQMIASQTPPGAQTAFTVDISHEVTYIDRLIKDGVIQNKRSLFTLAHKIARITYTIFFLVVTSPISITLALSGLIARSFVQNKMQSLTKLTASTATFPPIWNKTAPLSLFTCNVALTEFAIMDYINGVQETHLRAPQLAQFLTESGADVICLQEAFDSTTVRKTIAKTLQQAGYYIIMTPARQEVFGMSAGLLLASKYPIKDVGFLEFSDREGIDARTKKGVLAATVALSENCSVCIATTHMQAGYSGQSEQAHIEGRVNQFNQARTFIDAFCLNKTISDTFLAGDFNIGRFRALQVNQAAFKEDYQGEVIGLLQPSESSAGFKDLTVPDSPYSFSEYEPHQSNFDKQSALSQETGIDKGTSFDTSATSYIYLQPLLERFAQDTVVANAYRKPSVCDHIAFKNDPNSLFSETEYRYENPIPVGKIGTTTHFLSDHAAVQVTLKAKPKQ